MTEPGTELLPDTVVVRGGSNRDPGAVLQTFIDAVEDGDGPVVSVYCQPLVGGPVSEAVLGACLGGDIPHSRVQVSRVDRLTAEGFTLSLETSGGQSSCHYHLSLGCEPCLSVVERFIACFDEPIENPTGGKRRRP